MPYLHKYHILVQNPFTVQDVLKHAILLQGIVQAERDGKNT